MIYTQMQLSGASWNYSNTSSWWAMPHLLGTWVNQQFQIIQKTYEDIPIFRALYSLGVWYYASTEELANGFKLQDVRGEA